MTNFTNPADAHQFAGTQPPPPGQPAPTGYQQPVPNYAPQGQPQQAQPQYTQPQQAQPQYTQPQYGQPGGPIGYGAPAPAPAGPRPKTPLGGALMIGGAVLALIGTFLPWVSASGQSGNGYERFVWARGFSLTEVDSPAIMVVIGAFIMIALGVTTMLAGRVLPVTIIAMFSAVLGILAGGGMLVLLNDFADFVDGDLGIGLIMQPVAPVICLVGAIMATAARRQPTA